MNRINRQQKRDVEQFRAVTGASERVALEALKGAGWNLQRSLDTYFNNNAARAPARTAPKTDRRSIDRLWSKYKDSDGDMMSAAGVSQFCEDLDVDPSDISLLVFSFYCHAEHMGMFSKEEFVSGMSSLGCDSLEKLKDRLVELPAELESEENFRRVYDFAFLFARETGKRFVEKGLALALWQLMLSGSHQWDLLPEWCTFLEGKDIIAVQKDTWDQLLDFAETVRLDFSNFDPNGAWPYLIDEFVEHVCKAQGLTLPSPSLAAP